MMTFFATCTSWWIFFSFFLLILTKKVPLFVITHSTALKTCLLLLAFIKLRKIFFNNYCCMWVALAPWRTGRSLVFPTVKITTNNFCRYHLIRVCLCLQTLIKVSRWAIWPCFSPASVCALGESEAVKESLTIPLMISEGWETLVAHVDKQP